MKEGKQDLLFSLNNQWVISTSPATNIYLKLFSEGESGPIRKQGTEISSRIVYTPSNPLK